MALSSRPRLLIAIGAVIVLATAALVSVVIPLLNNEPLNNDPVDVSIELTLLNNAGVMIEAKGLRIYIDPYDLPANYSELPADAILTTHPHGDHYQYSTYDLLQTDETVCIFPENMTQEINRHDGIGVNPGDHVQVGDINITAFYMYTFPPEGIEFPASHPVEANYTSYIIDIDGFTIFHAGDSKNIDEYQQLTGTIDVAMLPLGPGCQSMADREIVSALEVIEPGFFIPIHWDGDAAEEYCSLYGNLIDQNTDCEILELAHFEAHTFQTDGDV
jgi:L-ascorbate metabolism protein UlaG (beta-lactamase superfamily)